MSCYICGETLARGRSSRGFCAPCRSIVQGIQSRCRILLNRANLPPAAVFACMDCGAPATDYDHRRYRRPLDVEPVCGSCNQRRGPAIDLREMVLVCTGAMPAMHRTVVYDDRPIMLEFETPQIDAVRAGRLKSVA